MRHFYVALRTPTEIREFVSIASVQPFGVTVENEGKSVNGKSLMGLFCLDHCTAHRVSMECSVEEYNSFYAATERFRP